VIYKTAWATLIAKIPQSYPSPSTIIKPYEIAHSILLEIGEYSNSRRLFGYHIHSEKLSKIGTGNSSIFIDNV
jgi:hypothetical protein